VEFLILNNFGTEIEAMMDRNSFNVGGALRAAIGPGMAMQPDQLKNNADGSKKSNWTAYRSWGKRGGKEFRFSKSGAPYLEEAYATHFVRNQKMQRALWVLELTPGGNHSNP
jgi:hypothetical protein